MFWGLFTKTHLTNKNICLLRLHMEITSNFLEKLDSCNQKYLGLLLKCANCYTLVNLLYANMQ